MYLFCLRLELVFLRFLCMIVECLPLSNMIEGNSCHTFDKATVLPGVGNVYQELQIIGYQQCVRECIKSSKCVRIIYVRTDLFCGLISTQQTDIPDLLGACFEKCPSGQSCVILTRRRNAICIEDSPSLPCQIGDASFDGNCYFFSTEYLNWTNANGVCKSMDGHLATLDTEAVNSLLTEKLDSLDDDTWHFIGAVTTGEGADWRWTENDKLLRNCSFVNWGSIYPISGRGRFCGTLTSDGDWINMECFQNRKFICQYSH